MLMCHKAKNILRTCAPALYGCGNDPATCANNKKSGLTVTVTGGSIYVLAAATGTVSAPTTVSAQGVPYALGDLPLDLVTPGMVEACYLHLSPKAKFAVSIDMLRRGIAAALKRAAQGDRGARSGEAVG